VLTPDGFKQAWDKLYEAGWKSISVPTEFGGQGAPMSVYVISEELLSGSNTAFNMYPGLCYGAAEVIETCGTHEQHTRYLHNMFGGKWGGTMCLTEPQAGSDVGSARSRAERRPDGKFNITGTKIYISGGDHDMAENIVHLVLARIDGAPPGTKGLSLFIVPRVRVNEDGSLGEFNNVNVGSIEHKMGINGSATCVLNFGENGECIGELVGTTEHIGMSQMFLMMNGARIAVGIQGIGVASSAYLNALAYTRDRQQGPSIKNWKDATAPRVAIIEHPDVRRMLLEMKAKVEGIRALITKLAIHHDRATTLAGKDDDAVAYNKGQVELLTPLVKAYGSDQAFRICELAIQSMGGAGYVKDYGIEQSCRDAKIFSIYEGTNHIQAMDLVGRKLGMHGGMHLQRLIGDIQAFVGENKAHASLGKDVQILGKAQEALFGASMMMMGWFQGGRLPMVPLNANRLLEMMSEVVVGWLLLDQAVIADKAVKNVAADHPDHGFYLGKIASAKFYARNILPSAAHKLELMQIEDDTALTIDDAVFG
jgi:alkylation response protein AidB-like acyl-CoA dehydrogenase